MNQLNRDVGNRLAGEATASSSGNGLYLEDQKCQYYAFSIFLWHIESIIMNYLEVLAQNVFSSCTKYSFQGSENPFWIFFLALVHDDIIESRIYLLDHVVENNISGFFAFVQGSHFCFVKN